MLQKRSVLSVTLGALTLLIGNGICSNYAQWGLKLKIKG